MCYNVINLLDSKTTGIVWTFLRNKALEKLCITIQYFWWAGWRGGR